MSDFLELVLARNYASATSMADPANLIRPRPMARFELPELITPELEPPAQEAQPRPIITAHMPAAPAVAPQAAQPVSQPQEQITRELLTIRETRLSPPAARAESQIRSLQPEQPASVTVQLHAEPVSRAAAPEQPQTIERKPQSPAEQSAVRPTPVLPMIVPLQPSAELPESSPPRAEPLRVQVRIGRIELQSPGTAPAPVRPAAVRSTPAVVRPVRSLDDYLRRRNEGR